MYSEEILQTLDSEMNKINQEHSDIYDSFGRDYKEEVNLHINLEDCLSLGNKLVDTLIETALLHRRMVIDISESIKKQIYLGNYAKASELLQKTTELIRFVEVNSVADKIQSEMRKLTL